MRRWLWLLLAGCGAAPLPPDAGVDGGTVIDAGPQLTAFQQSLLTSHNTVRANVMPAPSPPLPPMQWSASAQALAEDWAARCDFQHRDPNTMGENISASTQELTAAAVTRWASESADYTWSTNTCRLGQVCGHYTQIVWRSSIGLGCAQQRCETNSPFNTVAWYFLVCNYDPAGNFIGQKPY
ncbi:MAG: CAP domain-containing protein [Archangium sp.]|nr:CAP domain-containing protein [Archangium sp.]